MIVYVIISLINAAFIVIGAPLWKALSSTCFAVINGCKIFPITAYVHDIFYQAKRFGVYSYRTLISIFIAGIAVLWSCFMLPLFVIPMTDQWSINLLDIGGCLLVAQFFMSYAKRPDIGEHVFLLCTAISVMLMDVLTQGQTFSAQLLQARGSYGALGAGLVFLLIALCASSYQAPHGCAGLIRSLYIWVSDGLQFCWMVLACDVLWPSSLAVPFGILSGDQWFLACLKAFIMCVFKLAACAILLAFFKRYFILLERHKIYSGGAILLLSMLILCLHPS